MAGWLQLESVRHEAYELDKTLKEITSQRKISAAQDQIHQARLGHW